MSCECFTAFFFCFKYCLRLVFSTFPSCSQIPVVFCHSVIQGLGSYLLIYCFIQHFKRNCLLRNRRLVITFYHAAWWEVLSPVYKARVSHVLSLLRPAAATVNHNFFIYISSLTNRIPASRLKGCWGVWFRRFLLGFKFSFRIWQYRLCVS